jgi:hypothetical protein
MRRLGRILVGLSCVGLLALAFPAPAHAGAFDEQTFFTFSGPVELPGISLPGGTYMFKLADPNADRNVVQVFNHAGTVCYGTFLTRPADDPITSSGPAVTLEQRTAHAPEAVRSWFYPGDRTGREFSYAPQQSGH